MRTSAAILATAALLLVASSAEADTIIIYQAKDLPGATGEGRMLFPAAMSAPEGDLDARAKAVFQTLEAARPGLYAGSAVAASGGAVEITLADAGYENRAIVVSELYRSLISAGFATIKAPRLGSAPLGPDVVQMAAFLPVHELWHVLPPRKVVSGIVRLSSTEYQAVTKVQGRLTSKDQRLLDNLRGLLRSGSEEAKLAIIGYYEAQSVGGRSGSYLALLKVSEPVAVKMALLKALSKVKSPRVLDAIAELADNDTDPGVKSTAARILMDQGRKKYRAYILLEKLQSDDAEVVLGALKELGASKDRRVAAGLMALLKHSDERVRSATVGALAQLGANEQLGLAVDDESLAMELRLEAAGQLASGKAAVAEKGLRFQLVQGPPATAAAAAEKLGTSGAKGAIPHLQGALKHADATVRHAAAKALGALRAVDAMPALAEAAQKPEDKDVVEPVIVEVVSAMPLGDVIKMTDSKEVVLRKLALKSLATFAQKYDKVPPRIVSVLKGRLQDSDPEIRKAAVFALARTKDKALAADLMPLESDPDAFIREQVLVAAVEANLPGVDELLVRKLKDPSDDVKLRAAQGVRDRKTRAAMKQLMWMVDYRKIEVKRVVIAAIVAMAEKADHGKLFDIYARLLFDMDKEVKLQALEGMRVIVDPKVVSQLSTLVRDRDEEIQLKAIDALAKTGYPHAVEPLAGALMVGSKEVKMAAITAIGSLGVEQGRKPLQEFLMNESDMDLRTKCEQVLDTLP